MAVTPSTPIYLDNGEEAWTDGQYGSIDKFRNISRSIAYLKSKTDTLEDSTDPERRKRFTPIVLEEYFSYGVVQDGNNYKFDDSTSKAYSESFADLENIDTINTKAYIDLANGQAQLTPQTGTKIENAKCVGPWGGYAVNSCWEVGWEHTSPYWVTSGVFKSPFGANIPSVARAEVFTATATSAVTDISLVMHGNVNAEDYLYVELRTVDGNGKPTSTVIAREKAFLGKTMAVGFVAIPFQHKPKIVSGTKYAIVVRSPFTTYQNHYGLGGWGINCGDVCPTAESFTSYDNGLHWIKHGKSDAALPYNEGCKEPADFAFCVKTVPLTATYTTNANGEYVYLEPIRANPITTVILTPTETKPANTNIIYEVSKDFSTWYALNSGNSYTKEWGNPYPHVLYVRAKLTTTSASATPLLQQIDLHLDMVGATTAYLRSKIYYPPTTMPLGMAIWSELGAPYVDEPDTTVGIEIMKAAEKKDIFITDNSETEFQLTELPAEPMVYAVYTTDAGIGTALKEVKDFTVNYTTGLVTILSTLADGVLKLTYHPLFLKGLTEADFPLKCDFFSESFVATAAQTVFQLKTHPCDPIRTITVNEIEQIEDVDFTVDYVNNTITFGAGLTILDDVIIEYTPELIDKGLAINYRLTRTGVTKQVIINPSYYQYRV